jgi:hypothetical protein
VEAEEQQKNLIQNELMVATKLKHTPAIASSERTAVNWEQASAISCQT